MFIFYINHNENESWPIVIMCWRREQLLEVVLLMGMSGSLDTSCFLLTCLKTTWQKTTAQLASARGPYRKRRCRDGWNASRPAHWRNAQAEPKSAAQTVELTVTEVSPRQQIHKHTRARAHSPSHTRVRKWDFFWPRCWLCLEREVGRTDFTTFNEPGYFMWVSSAWNSRVKKYNNIES